MARAPKRDKFGRFVSKKKPSKPATGTTKRSTANAGKRPATPTTRKTSPAPKPPKRDRYGRFVPKGKAGKIKRPPPLRDAEGHFLPREVAEAVEAAREHAAEVATYKQDRKGRWHDEHGRVLPKASWPTTEKPAVPSAPPSAPPPAPAVEAVPEVVPQPPQAAEVPPAPPPPTPIVPSRPVATEAAMEDLADRFGYMARMPWYADETPGGYPRIHTTGSSKRPGDGVAHSDAAHELLRWWRTLPDDHPLRQVDALQINAHYADGQNRTGEWATSLVTDPDTAVQMAASALDDAGERYHDGQTVSLVFYTMNAGDYTITMGG